MIKKIDIYIIRKFLGTFFFAIALIITIAVMFDINERVDKFLEAPLKAIVFEYYLNFVPYFANLFSPLFAFIAVIFFTSKMANNSEVIAMLSSGISLRRLLRPYFVAATIIAGFTYYLSAYVIPPSNETRINFQNKYFDNKKVEYGSNIQLKVTPEVIAYFSRYDAHSKTGYRFSLERFENKVLKSRLTAQSIGYDTLYQWHIKNYLIREFDGMHEYITKGEKLDTIIPIEPADFLVSSYESELMTSDELLQYVEKQRKRGMGNTLAFEVEYARRIASAASVFILTLMGVSVASRKAKGGMGLNIGIGLGLSFGYILFSTITASFATSGTTSPIIAVWMPNLIFALIALVLYRRAEL